MSGTDGGTEVCIAGAGIMGLSLALELRRRGAGVMVLDRGEPLAGASTAAAGMLAAGDPENPPELRALAEMSVRVYPEYLERLRALCGIAVKFQTAATLQGIREGEGLDARQLAEILPELRPGAMRFALLEEHSVDPRELAVALLAAARNAAVDVRSGEGVVSVESDGEGVRVRTDSGEVRAAQFVDCTGAWSRSVAPEVVPTVVPRKGQMLAVHLTAGFAMEIVVRTPEIYIVPRRPAGGVRRAIIGATVEEAGFDTTVHRADIAGLKARAADLLPPLAEAEVVEAWAGIRPGTRDGLPLLGQLPGRAGQYIAAGHYRNGILLAPATARVMAQVLFGEAAEVDLQPFDTGRFVGRFLAGDGS